MPDFGSDVSTFPDLDPGFSSMTGARVLAEAMARRFTTPRGSLVGSPTYGVDVREWLNESMTRARLTEWARALEQEAEKDERIESAEVSLSYDSAAMALRISALLEAADRTFALVLVVTAVSLTILDAR